MLKTLIAATAALLVATTAFAQSEKMKSPGSSEYSAGQTMQKSKTAVAPGKMKKSKTAALGKMRKSKASTAPAASEPTTTGSAATKKKY
jgi:hypothetical protein